MEGGEVQLSHEKRNREPPHCATHHADDGLPAHHPIGGGRNTFDAAWLVCPSGREHQRVLDARPGRSIADDRILRVDAVSERSG